MLRSKTPEVPVERKQAFIETKKPSSNTHARANNTLHT